MEDVYPFMLHSEEFSLYHRVCICPLCMVSWPEPASLTGPQNGACDGPAVRLTFVRVNISHFNHCQGIGVMWSARHCSGYPLQTCCSRIAWCTCGLPFGIRSSRCTPFCTDMPWFVRLMALVSPRYGRWLHLGIVWPHLAQRMLIPSP